MLETFFNSTRTQNFVPAIHDLTKDIGIQSKKKLKRDARKTSKTNEMVDGTNLLKDDAAGISKQNDDESLKHFTAKVEDEFGHCKAENPLEQHNFQMKHDDRMTFWGHTNNSSLRDRELFNRNVFSKIMKSSRIRSCE